MEIGIYQAKSHFAGLLQRVAQGENITITKRGKPIAKLVKVMPESSVSIDATIEAIKKMRQSRAVIRSKQINVWKNKGQA